jgi:hypothetical protein
MPTQSISEPLLIRVKATVEKHWVQPKRDAQPAPTPADRVESVAARVLDTMLTRQYRVGPLPIPEVHAELLARVRRRVERNEPIAVTVGYGPLKNPNAVPYSRADWGEFFALCHLIAWHNKVQAVYAPGLAISIAFDDSTLVMANHADKRLMKSYMASIAELIGKLGFDEVISASMKHSFFAWLFHFGLYQYAAWRVRRWERDPAHQEQIDRMRDAARRNVVLPTSLDPAQHDEYIRQAAHRYRVYWEALQLSGLTNSKTRLIAMYLDGSQHHIPQQVCFHLTSLDKGQVTQPWQGIGGLLDNGHGKLEPFVLTAGRQQRHKTQTVSGLDFGFGADFDRISVAAPLTVAAELPTSKPESPQLAEKKPA